MATPNYGLPIYTGSEPYSLKTVANQITNSTDAALKVVADSAGKSFANATARDAYFGATPPNNSRAYRQDLYYQEVYIAGTGWVPLIGNPFAVVNGVWNMPTTGGFVSVGTTTFPWTETSDRMNWHNPSLNPSRITPTFPGVYRIVANLRWSTNGADQRILRLLKNGSEIASDHDGSPATTSSTGLSTSYSVAMNGTTDYIELQSFQNSGSTLSTTGNLTVEYLGP